MMIVMYDSCMMIVMYRQATQMKDEILGLFL